VELLVLLLVVKSCTWYNNLVVDDDDDNDDNDDNGCSCCSWRRRGLGVEPVGLVTQLFVNTTSSGAIRIGSRPATLIVVILLFVEVVVANQVGIVIRSAEEQFAMVLRLLRLLLTTPVGGRCSQATPFVRWKRCSRQQLINSPTWW
jgi:hypothetical protein